MTSVPVTLGDRSYAIAIEGGLIATAGERLRALAAPRRVTVVTDETVAALHLPALLGGLAGFDPQSIVLPAGEATKSFTRLERLCDALLHSDVTRSDIVLAFGGGVIGDLTGFAAAIVKRGVPFLQVPTTLLAMVDSSVGGKTAINTRAGKNLVGAFYQPIAVWADLDLLQSLPLRQMQAGYAEIVKYGLISDPAFFDWCEANAPALLAHDRQALAHAVAESCRAKAAIVAADERETRDLRALLNLGHTFGHALEAETGFSDRLLHGEAVGIGMAQAFRFSARLGLCSGQDAMRVTRHLQQQGLPAWPGDAGVEPSAATRLVAHMQHDKKKTSAGLPFVLARGIGEAFVAKDIALADVEAFLASDAP